MKPIWYEGYGQSGKTTRLVNEYIRLVEAGTRTDNILVLAASAREVRRWRNLLTLPVTGALQISTFWGWVQKELVRYWPEIEAGLKPGPQRVQPTFLNAEAAHYLLTLLVERRLPQGCFDMMTATSAQIALQVISSMNLAAMNRLSLEDAMDRMTRISPGDATKEKGYSDAFNLAAEFKKQCLDARCIDYSLAVELYNEYLLKKEWYQEELATRFPFLLIDDLDEASASEVDLIEVLLRRSTRAFLAFNPWGGLARYFGAVPELAKEKIYPLCQVELCDEPYGCSPEAAKLASALATNIETETRDQIKTRVFDPEGIETEFRARMINELADIVIKTLDSGVKPQEIAVISPASDLVLEQGLGHRLREAGYDVQSLTRKHRLCDEDYTRVLVTLVLLVSPDARWPLGMTDLSRALSLVLNLDPVRSSLLASKCRGTLPDLDEIGLRSRIGFEAGRRYEGLREWAAMTAASVQDPDRLFQKIFGDIMAPVMENNEDINTARQIINSSIKFKDAYSQLGLLQGQPFISRLVELIKRGIVAAEALKSDDLRDDAVLLATPITFIRSGLSVKHQFWTDFNHPGWFRGTGFALGNAAVLARDWDGRWDDELDQALRRKTGAAEVASLLQRCTGQVTTVQSIYGDLGQELANPLADIILESVVLAWN